MFQYRFLPHTADISIEIEADSLEELFQAALLGMNQVLRENFCSESDSLSRVQPVEVHSVDPTTLLIDFLSAVLTHSYLEKTLFCRVEVKEVSHNAIRASLYGRPVDYFDDDIKAVTYHGAEVVREGDKWRTPIVFDI